MNKAHPKPHLIASWPGGSGHCSCMCSRCFTWLRPHPTTGRPRGGRCVCKDCPCGGHEFAITGRALASSTSEVVSA